MTRIHKGIVSFCAVLGAALLLIGLNIGPASAAYSGAFTKSEYYAVGTASANTLSEVENNDCKCGGKTVTRDTSGPWPRFWGINYQGGGCGCVSVTYKQFNQGKPWYVYHKSNALGW